LLLVEPGAAPPVGDSCLEDWLRLPADDADVRARIRALAGRAAHHPARPSLGEHGELTHRDSIVFLSPVDRRLVAPLVDSFGCGVADAELHDAAWPDGGAEQALRVHMSRLRRRLAPLGLTIVSVRGFGYMLRDDAR
jgi:DNA-binding response OmpR family regulator